MMSIFSCAYWPLVFLLWRNVCLGLLLIFRLGFVVVVVIELHENESLCSHLQLSVTPWTIQPMEFSRPEYWSRWLLPSPGDLPNWGIEPRSPALQVDSLPAELLGKLSCTSCLYILEIKPLSVTSFANILSHSLGLLFVYGFLCCAEAWKFV